MSSRFPYWMAVPTLTPRDHIWWGRDIRPCRSVWIVLWALLHTSELVSFCLCPHASVCLPSPVSILRWSTQQPRASSFTCYFISTRKYLHALSFSAVHHPFLKTCVKAPTLRTSLTRRNICHIFHSTAHWSSWSQLLLQIFIQSIYSLVFACLLACLWKSFST